ncbi:MAG: hemerythrin domain-containing protein [Acidobacteria bacterium]|nr:hemerythrin domain-containing protein [Acidobacteriota bacterium]
MKTQNPINRFYQEHEQVLEQIQELEHCVDDLRRKGYSKRRASQFARALKAVDYGVRIHNAAEEKALLEMLDQTLPTYGPTFIMRQEYRELRRAARRLQTAFQGWQRDAKNRQKLAHLGLTTEWLIKLLQEHIDKGNDVLFPLAQSVLTQQQMDQVVQRLDQFMAAS